MILQVFSSSAHFRCAQTSASHSMHTFTAANTLARRQVVLAQVRSVLDAPPFEALIDRQACSDQHCGPSAADVPVMH